MMDSIKNRTDLPVLLLHNLDQAWTPDEIHRASCEVSELESAMRALGHPVINLPVLNADLQTALRGYNPEQHVVFNWCEELPGLPQSDALVAQTLDDLRFAYTGSPPAVLSLSWDKPRVKRLLDKCGVPTPRWSLCNSHQTDGWDCFPAIVKPAREHCSLGVTTDAVVLTPDELCDRVTYVTDVFHQPALVEDFIDGREFHITLWGNGAVEMLPPAEMDFAAFENMRERLCTFDSKFSPGSRHYDKIQLRLPAPLNRDEYTALERTATAAYRILGCRDYGRLDIRLRNGIFYVLDINPNADISSQTSMASSAEAAGYSYGAMASRIVNLASQRHPIFGAEWF